MGEKTVVIALGGNALGNNVEEQKIAVAKTATVIVDLIEQGLNIVLTHGNGPQVGMIQKAMDAFVTDTADARFVSGGSGEEPAEAEKININTADEDTLMTLNGIGKAKAEAIIAYREEHGGFRSIEEIREVNGIKDSVFERIRESITVE